MGNLQDHTQRPGLQAPEHYDRSEKKWHIQYNPNMCTHYHCTYRVILEKPVSEKKANVYYNLKRSHVESGKGFMPDEIITSITKGIKLTRVSVMICETIVKYGRRWIQSTVYLQNHTFCYFGGSVEVMNLRWESRDLLQDLRDVANCIAVRHQSDMEKASKEAKRIRRAEPQQRRIAKFQKMIRTAGFDGLSAADQNPVRKPLSLRRSCRRSRSTSSLFLLRPKPHRRVFSPVRRVPHEDTVFRSGMQSTALALMSCENAKAKGDVPYPMVPIYVAVIYCDLGLEPPWVYHQLEFTRKACEDTGIFSWCRIH